MVGTSPGEKQGGLVNHILRNIEVESIPKNIPEKIEIQMSEVQLDDVIHVSDLTVGEGVKITNDPSDAILTVHVEKVKEEKVDEDEAVESAEAEAPTDAETKKEAGSK